MEITPLRDVDFEAFIDELWLPAQRELAAMTSYTLADDVRSDGVSFHCKRRDADGFATYVGRQDGRLVAYVYAEVQTPPPIYEEIRECHVGELYVDDAVRRHGAATALLEAIEEWGRAHDCERLDLNVDVQNEAARVLYERAGYRVERQNMKKPL
ncbi:GNAT family N-acetyltransferase [Halarchaeum sp. P4]|uniref:GNAT family N-acetyltransferase n=1 Tax=Halarchaeum sp. P4 TaxID=3421639 RepID=UPI003EBB7F67